MLSADLKLPVIEQRFKSGSEKKLVEKDAHLS